jgi:mannan endo-1,4-beta-mannosidase
MFNYFTSVKGLHNLLWVYSADNSPTTQLLLYPGSDVVDVIGIDDYHLQHEYPDYFSMRATGKPVEYTERGPQVIDGTSQVFVGFIHDTAYKFPMVGYFMAYIAGNAIVNNPGASALMNDPNTANQNDVSAAMTCIRSSGTIAAKFACAIN